MTSAQSSPLPSSSKTGAPRGDAGRISQGIPGIEPTERFAWGLVATALLGALGAVMPVLGSLSVYVLVGLLVLLVVDVVLCANPRHIRVKRLLPAPVTVGAPAPLLWILEAPRAARIQLTDTLPPSVRGGTVGTVLEAEARLGAKERVTMRHHITFARMGHHVFGRIALRTLGPLGLVRLRTRLPLFTEAKVIPDVRQLSRRAEQVMAGREHTGRRRRPVPREGGELDSLRDYQRGDDVRLVEWKASARARQLVVKRMVPETRRDFLLLLDTGRQLAGARRAGSDLVPRFEEAVSVALTRAAAARERGDRVGLIAFAADIRAYLPAAQGRTQLRRLAEHIAALDVVPEESDYQTALRFLCARQPRRARVIVVSDLIDDVSARALSSAVPVLRGRHSPLLLAVGDPSLAYSSREPTGNGSESPWLSFAADRLLEQRRSGLAAVRASGCEVVDMTETDTASAALRATLRAEFS
ncbi:MAG: DUF58 domain-containing protein [Myxococcota bacterium]